ncbi:MAG: thioredoxin family protein [Gammaproteobacteria bacterium]|nr:thioredoxin family protein [Gammaproteobacteria bacterium]
MEVKILGAGCPNCRTLARRSREALERLGSSATVQLVDDDYAAMAEYRIMSIPALVIDDELIFNGRVPNVESLVSIFQGHGA